MHCCFISIEDFFSLEDKKHRLNIIHIIEHWACKDVYDSIVKLNIIFIGDKFYFRELLISRL